MSVLVLRLAGPLQAWGDSSRYTVRATNDAPTRSGVLGLLCAAEGRSRDANLADLQELRIAVRIDQPGILLRDFQTASNKYTKQDTMPLSTRFYRENAVYTVFIEGVSESLKHFASALRQPKFPLYLGRRSCVPTLPLMLEIIDSDIASSIAHYPWQAEQWYRQRLERKGRGYWAEVLMDQDIPWASGSGDERIIEETHRDVPVSFSRERREYLWRTVLRTSVQILAPAFTENEMTSLPATESPRAMSEVDVSEPYSVPSSHLSRSVSTDHDPMNLL